MQVRLTYTVTTPCAAHRGLFPKDHAKEKKAGNYQFMKHDEAAEILGGPCIPGQASFHQVVDESEVMSKIEIMTDLGHEVSAEYLT